LSLSSDQEHALPATPTKKQTTSFFRVVKTQTNKCKNKKQKQKTKGYRKPTAKLFLHL